MVATAASACEVVRRATIAIELAGGVPLVDLQINGAPATFVLDTGAARTTLNEPSVHRLGLKLDPMVGTTLLGVGGIERHQNATPQSVVLGTLPLHGTAPFLSLSVASLGVSVLNGRIVDGLLGRDLLGAYDLDLDYRRRRIDIYSVTNCVGAFLPWKAPYDRATPVPGYDRMPVFVTGLDAHALRTLLDTGAAASLLTASGSFRAGVSGAPDQGKMARAVGIGGHPLPGRLRRFDMLQVAGAVTRDPTLLVSDVHLVPLVDLLLGSDWLLKHRVWLSIATSQMFVARP